MFIHIYVGGKQVDKFLIRNPVVSKGSSWTSRGKVWEVVEIFACTSESIHCNCVEW